MRRLVAVLAVVAIFLAAPIELEESAWAVDVPDPTICFLLGVSAAGLALGLWSRQLTGAAEPVGPERRPRAE